MALDGLTNTGRVVDGLTNTGRPDHRKRLRACAACSGAGALDPAVPSCDLPPFGPGWILSSGATLANGWKRRPPSPADPHQLASAARSRQGVSNSEGLSYEPNIDFFAGFDIIEPPCRSTSTTSMLHFRTDSGLTGRRMTR
jgi:hypothetical protein